MKLEVITLFLSLKARQQHFHLTCCCPIVIQLVLVDLRLLPNVSQTILCPSYILTVLVHLYRLISNTWQTSVWWLIRTSAWYVVVASGRYLLLDITITPPPFPHLIRSLTFKVCTLFLDSTILYPYWYSTSNGPEVRNRETFELWISINSNWKVHSLK